jgi:hypothetical protein
MCVCVEVLLIKCDYAHPEWKQAHTCHVYVSATSLLILLLITLLSFFCTFPRQQSLFALLWMVTVFGLVFTDKCYVRVFSPAWTVATAIALLIGLINLLISNILAFCVSRKHVIVFAFFCFGAVGVVIAQVGLLSIAGQISLASGNYLIVLTAVLLVLFAYEHYVYWFIMRKQCYY